MTAGARLLAALLAALLTAAAGAATPRGGRGFQFGVIGHAFGGAPDDALGQAIRQTGQAGLAFVVATGIKADNEPCGDALYARRKSALDDSVRPLIVSLAAADWSECRSLQGRSAAAERLTRLRELLFDDELSLGTHKIPLARLSSNVKFRSYAENAHWEHGRVLFATVNLPANNNHFRPEAGRNSEFEDRLVANRWWLQRLFAVAQQGKLDGIVLFSDGDIGALAEPKTAGAARQDGFAAARRQIRALAQKFPGQVLLVDAHPAAAGAPAIAWRGNLGHVSVGAHWIEIRVAAARAPAARAPLFALGAKRVPHAANGN